MAEGWGALIDQPESGVIRRGSCRQGLRLLEERRSMLHNGSRLRTVGGMRLRRILRMLEVDRRRVNRSVFETHSRLIKGPGLSLRNVAWWKNDRSLYFFPKNR